MPPFRASVAELIGTFALTFVGGAAIILTAGQDSHLIAVAMAHGLILACMVSATLHISGGQINPAVSVALALVNRQSWKQAVIFSLAQILGAILAALLLQLLFSRALGEQVVGNLGATLGSLTTNGHAMPVLACALEFIATFFLMFVIMGTAVDPRGVGRTAAVGGFAIGLTVAADILMIGPLTGASMNPARSVGPALVASAWSHHWVYWIGPLLGAAAAAAVYQAVFTPPRPAAIE